jgi:hypothetical protein
MTSEVQSLPEKIAYFLGIVECLTWKQACSDQGSTSFDPVQKLSIYAVICVALCPEFDAFVMASYTYLDILYDSRSTLHHLPKIRHPQTSDRISPFRSIPARPWYNTRTIQHLPSLMIRAIAASRAPFSRIKQEVLPMSIQPRINEAHCRLPSS